MNAEQIYQQINKKRSFLCIGLDTDMEKIPEFLKLEEDPVFEFNKKIVDKTHDLAIAYKPNLAFYESLGVRGWESLEKTVNYIKLNYPEVFVIADAKRGDIGNTSKMYASAFFKIMNFDAVTIAPYMGEDSVTPFMAYEGKWVIVLALTSNKGAYDFQMMVDRDSEDWLFERVIQRTKKWGNTDNTMFVVGATKAAMLESVRKHARDHFLLVPGVGAQGGSLSEVAEYGMNDQCGLIVNSSRGIIYADSSEQFDQVAREKAMEIRDEMHGLLAAKGL
jgi:orotidine-5'-phosphate decarboxylase